MAEVNSFFSSATPRLLSVLRIVSAFFFMLHGAQKLFGFLTPPGAQGPPLFSQVGIGGILEFFGGLLLLLGLFTRPVAFILSGMMAVAYFQMHLMGAVSKGNPGWFWPIAQGGNGGELAALYCFVFLFLAVAGGGEWSLDRLLRRR
ncbi:MAG TPA: DoxX family protein [Pyrinomonadaceae bacterium]|nr:DoxX family protein [Pyrinomonadaceae bacterium]